MKSDDRIVVVVGILAARVPQELGGGGEWNRQVYRTLWRPMYACSFQCVVGTLYRLRRIDE